MDKCVECNINDKFENKKYCEHCYNNAVYLVSLWLDCKEGKISEEEANFLAKKCRSISIADREMEIN
jgi:hypothetical protein